MIKKFDIWCAEGGKKKISIILAAAAVLWIVMWAVFPMEFYSLFFASVVGSNIFLLFMELVLTFPLNMLFSKVIGSNISMFFTGISDIVFMTAVSYTFSIFRFSQPLWIVLAIALHFVSKLFIDGRPYEEESVKLPMLKRKPLTAVLAALAHTAAADGLMLVLFYTSAHIFTR